MPALREQQQQLGQGSAVILPKNNVRMFEGINRGIQGIKEDRTAKAEEQSEKDSLRAVGDYDGMTPLEAGIFKKEVAAKNKEIDAFIRANPNASTGEIKGIVRQIESELGSVSSEHVSNSKKQREHDLNVEKANKAGKKYWNDGLYGGYAVEDSFDNEDGTLNRDAYKSYMGGIKDGHEMISAQDIFGEVINDKEAIKSIGDADKIAGDSRILTKEVTREVKQGATTKKITDTVLTEWGEMAAIKTRMGSNANANRDVVHQATDEDIENAEIRLEVMGVPKDKWAEWMPSALVMNSVPERRITKSTQSVQNTTRAPRGSGTNSGEFNFKVSGGLSVGDDGSVYDRSELSVRPFGLEDGSTLTGFTTDERGRVGVIIEENTGTKKKPKWVKTPVFDQLTVDKYYNALIDRSDKAEKAAFKKAYDELSLTKSGKDEKLSKITSLVDKYESSQAYVNDDEEGLVKELEKEGITVPEGFAERIKGADYDFDDIEDRKRIIQELVDHNTADKEDDNQVLLKGTSYNKEDVESTAEEAGMTVDEYIEWYERTQ